jgi:alpha-beta hydrolase superfamily lysophospholipase
VSIFDRDEFNQSLFFPQSNASPAPAGASDQMIEVDGARLHVRLHASPAASRTLLLFHGNGEIVADYDAAASRFARAGVALAVMDYRGYGRSTGTPTLRTLISDARRVADVVRASRMTSARYSSRQPSWRSGDCHCSCCMANATR